VVALALAALAGCGDTASTNEYVDAVNKAQTDFAASVSKVQADAAGTTPEKAKDVFTSLGDGVDKVVSDLKAVSAPDKVKDLHDQLIDQVSSFGTAIKKAGDSITGKDPRKITEAQTKFATEIASVGTKISSTIDEINKKLQE
jgi:hypothetical protein